MQNDLFCYIIIDTYKLIFNIFILVERFVQKYKRNSCPTKIIERQLFVLKGQHRL